MKKLLILLIVFMFFPLINADVVSLNSGGSDDIIINPDEYLEGFFSGEIPAVGAVCGNGVLETGEGCDDGNVVSGDGCSATCTIEAVITPPDDGGGGVTTISISLDPTEFNINLAVNTNLERTIHVTNLRSSSITVTVSQQNLGNMVILDETSLTLGPGETRDLKVIFVALSETGIFTGKIVIGGKVVSVSLNVKTRLLLFDSNIAVLNEDYKVPQGNKLRTIVTLIPMGDKERLDVQLNYVVKDYAGKTYLTRSETVFVEDQVNFKRNFDTGMLPLGTYIVGLELVYSGGVAPSSAHFEVIEKLPMPFGILAFYLIAAVLIVLILIILILINKKRKEDK